MGIGAQKCGTSWLFKALSIHPKIKFPGGKEVHFWDQHYSRGTEWYIQLFNNNTYFDGDITPAYGFLPVQVIKKIYEVMPRLQLIYLIRNPIERAWSSARMALSRAEMLHEEASDQWFIDHFKSKGSLDRGDYETCIRQWRSIFHFNQLLIIRHEMIMTIPVSTANVILNHIGLESFFDISYDQKLREKVFEGDGTAIRPTLKHVLQEIYRNRIDSLQEYLQEDFSDWIK